MKKILNEASVASLLTSFATCMMVVAANSRCCYVFHQPKQPDTMKKYKKF